MKQEQHMHVKVVCFKQGEKLVASYKLSQRHICQRKWNTSLAGSFGSQAPILHPSGQKLIKAALRIEMLVGPSETLIQI